MKSRSFPFGKLRIRMTALEVALPSRWGPDYIIRRNALMSPDMTQFSRIGKDTEAELNA